MDINEIVKEWSYRVSDGIPKTNNNLHLIELKNLLIEKKYPMKFIELFIGNLRGDNQSKKSTILEAEFDKKPFLKYDKNGGKIYTNIDKFIKSFVKKLNSSSIKPNCFVRIAKSFNIKPGSANPRVDVTIDCKDIGAGSRGVVFDEVAKFKGNLKTKYDSSNKFSSAGHVETTVDGILVRIEFKGGKKSAGEASMTTDLKEAMVGLWYQSKLNKPVTKSNIVDVINTLISELPSMVGESNSIKSNIESFLKGLPTDNPKAPILNALNDTLSAGLTIKNAYKGWIWERDKTFDKIRSAASKITGMTADKWNPGDVYLMKGNKSSKAITESDSMKTTSINQKIAPINNLFVPEWGSKDGSIVSVSLKQAKAQAGKGKQYLKKFDGTASDFDYNLTSDEQKLKSEEPDVLMSALIPQIEEWRSTIPGKLNGLNIKYSYSPASISGLMDEKKVNFLYQKYASLKMFAFMVDKLKKDEGVFIDAAAFSLSLTGYNPTFFKVKGKTSGKAGAAEKFEAGGGIELINNSIKVTDTNTNAGITFEFKVKNNDLGTGDMKMNIRFNGTTQATLEMLSAKWG